MYSKSDLETKRREYIIFYYYIISCDNISRITFLNNFFFVLGKSPSNFRFKSYGLVIRIYGKLISTFELLFNCLKNFGRKISGQDYVNVDYFLS